MMVGSSLNNIISAVQMDRFFDVELNDNIQKPGKPERCVDYAYVGFLIFRVRWPTPNRSFCNQIVTDLYLALAWSILFHVSFLLGPHFGVFYSWNRAPINATFGVYMSIGRHRDNHTC